MLLLEIIQHILLVGASMTLHDAGNRSPVSYIQHLLDFFSRKQIHQSLQPQVLLLAGIVLSEADHLQVGVDESVEIQPKLVQSSGFETSDYPLHPKNGAQLEHLYVSHEHRQVQSFADVLVQFKGLSLLAHRFADEVEDDEQLLDDFELGLLGLLLISTLLARFSMI